MPKLKAYVSIGIDLSYGDGDFSVSMEIADLSQYQVNQLRIAAVVALAQMERIWEDSPNHPARQNCAASEQAMTAPQPAQSGERS